MTHGLLWLSSFFEPTVRSGLPHPQPWTPFWPENLTLLEPVFLVLIWLWGGTDLPPPTNNRTYGAGGSKIELELLPRLMPDKRIYHFQIPRTTPTNGLKNLLFQGVYEVRRGPPL